MNVWHGLARRFFRCGLRWRASGRPAHSGPGSARMPGYGLRMAYPDELLWRNQVLEIFGDDCYRLRWLPPQPVILDVGANIGTFSLGAWWLRPQATIVAIEPAPANLDYLRRNVTQAGPVIVVQPVAAGAEAGVVRIAGPASDALRTGGQAGEEVAQRPVRDFIGPHVDLLKIDVEGAEHDVLAGAGEALKRVARVAVEYHDYAGRASLLPELLDALKHQGFTRFEVDSLRRFPPSGEGLPEACCLVHGWRTGGPG